MPLTPADRRHRRRLLALSCLPLTGLAPQRAAAQAAPPLLTVSGKRASGAGASMTFDQLALQGLPQRKLVTTTPWYPNAAEFFGPLMREVLKAAGASLEATTLRCTALNDYRVEIPMQDVQRFDVVLAHQLNGKPMAVRDKGPLFVIYPFDEQPQLRTTTYYSRCIWQLKAIEVL